MSRTQILTLVPALAVVAAIGWSTRDDGDGALGDLRGGGTTTAAAQAEEAAGSGGDRRADPRVDSAHVEARAGRPWHASVLLRAAARAGVALTRDDILLLARSDLAWRNWPGAIEQLDGKPWLGEVGGGEGWLLLGRAREARSEWPAAATAYDRYFASSHAGSNPMAAGLRARHARALANAGRAADARAALDKAASAPVIVSWATLDAASPAADSGRTAEVRTLLERVTDSVARVQAWELVPRSLLASGDTAASVEAYRAATGSAVGGARRARAFAILGDLARARGDQAAARTAYASALQAGVGNPGAARAAKAFLAMGGMDAEQALLAAQALERANDDPTALQAYDLHVRLKGSAAVGEAIRLDRARIMGVTKGRENDAVGEFRALSTSTRDRVGAPALELWADLRQTQGRTTDMDSLRAWLLQRYPTSPEAADVVFFRGDAPHDRNDLDAAMREYRRVMAMAPDQDRAGLASMRVAQILVLRKDHAGAAQVYEDYLAGFPSGRRWQEASYWAARSRLILGDTAKARALVARLKSDDPFSYYTVVASDLFGEPYTLNLPPGEATPTPDWLADGLTRLDLLTAGGLPGGAAAEVERLTVRARAAGAPALLALAEGLSVRDRTIEGINLAFEVRRLGNPWTMRLAKVVYPWRYEEVFKREAAEDGVDPYLTAALARQESAFDPDIRSSANAIGLMQMLPSTAAEVARAVGPAGFTGEMLEIPDVNVHLGTLHLRDLLETNQGDITRFLAGYNAGQHRVSRWKDFAEAGDPLTFTERIPFAEPRDYVKQVQRNVVVYKLLYPGGAKPSL